MKTQRGFTLIEMAIVLVIVTILIGGLAMPLSAQIQARRIAETRQTLQEAREAIIGYAMTHNATTPPTHPYLPCPNQNGDGTEGPRDAAGICLNRTGYLPWVTLGTAPQDAWGNRLRYAVDKGFTNKDSGFSASSTLPPDPIVICSTHTCSSSSPDVADNVIFVLVSHGPNGWGAQNMNNAPGVLQAPPNGLDEKKNLDPNPVYISRSPYKAADGTAVERAKEFDDLTVWVSHSVLIAKVCPAGSDCYP